MTSRDRRALSIGGGVVLAGLLCFRALPAAWRGWRDGHEELIAQRELLDRADHALGQLDSIESRAGRTREQLIALAPRLVSGQTDAEAQADLNGRLALHANHERTRLLRADPVADSGRVGELHRVRLRLVVESDWSGLVGFLKSVVADPAVLRITSVAVRGAETPQMTAGPEVLTGEVEATGWYLARRVSATEGGQ